MEADDFGEDFARGGRPHVYIDKLALPGSLSLSTAPGVRSSLIELLAGHLARGHYVTIRVHGHSDDILVVQIEELLHTILLNDADAGRGEDDAAVCGVA